MNVSKNPFPILINGVASKVDAYSIGGYTYLKLGDLKQAGLKVVFNETDKKIEITTAVAENTTKPVTETTQPATPTPTPPSQETIQPIETTPEPEPEQESEPDLKVYNAKLELLTEAYNQDVEKIKDDAREEASQLSQDFYKKYPNAKREDSVNWGRLFKLLDENINIVHKKADEQVELRTKQYNVDVAELKQEYGVK